MTETALPRLRLESFVAGRFAAGGGERVEAFDPWRGEVLAEVASASAAQVDQAIAAARTAFDKTDWPERAPTERGAILSAIAAGLAARQQELATIEAVNAGKPISGAM